MKAYNNILRESFLKMEKAASSIIDSFTDELGINIWPTLRLCYNYDFYHGNTERYISRNLKNDSYFNKKTHLVSQPLLRGLGRVQRGSCLLIDLPNHYTLKTSSGLYDPYLDPISNVVAELGLFPLKMIDGRFAEEVKTVNPVVELPNDVVEQKMVHIQTLKEPKGYDEYVELCLEHCVPPLHLASIWELHLSMRSCYEFFLEYLKALEPRVVVTVCYYSPANMGLALACKELGIPCVDYQHGLQAWPHLGYNFGYIPKHGYETIPKWFLTWGKLPNEHLTSFFSTQEYHEAIVGGKPAHIAWERGVLPEDERLMKAFTELIRDREVVCVTLPLLLSDEQLRELEKAIVESPENWLWLFRKHPLHRGEKFIPWFIDDHPGKIEHEISSELSLETVLASSKHVVTSHSTCGLEALSSFGIRTTVLCPTAADTYFEDELKQGLFSLAQNTQEILASVEDGISKKISATNTYSSSDSKYVLQAFKKIVSQSV